MAQPMAQDGALPFSDVNQLLSAAAAAERQQALVARIFPTLPQQGPSSSHLDNFAYLSSLKQRLQHYLTQHSANITAPGSPYIWHKEPPLLSLVSNSSPRQPHILLQLHTGGECVEDEWFITYLLLESTKLFADDHLVISVEDEDGQFLLIQAADHLPSWVTPENVVNRVWIFQGHLHILPPHLTSTKCHDSVSQSDAVAFVRDSTTLTRAADQVEAAAFARVSDYPQAAADHQHRVLAYLPQSVARILSQEPQLISTCVHSILARDIISSRTSSKMLHFPPPSQAVPRFASHQSPPSNSSANDDVIILTPVKLTRYLFVQLSYDRFFPPRQLGRDWQAAVEKYRLRMHNNSRGQALAHVEDQEKVRKEMRQGKWRDLGAKIWCGMEMAYHESLTRRRRATRSETSDDFNIPSDERHLLVQSLSRLGYFGQEIQGSARWKVLEKTAIQQWKSRLVHDEADPSAESNFSFSGKVQEVQAKIAEEACEPLSIPSDASTPLISQHEDSEDWMHLDADDLKKLLGSGIGHRSGGASTSGEEEAFQQLNTFTSKMEEFLDRRSDAQGALFDDEMDTDEELDQDDLLFEDLDDVEDCKTRREHHNAIRVVTDEDKQKLVDRLLPRMTQEEWCNKSAPPARLQSSGKHAADPAGDMDLDDAEKESFLPSIDELAASRCATKNEDTEKPPGTVYKPKNLSKAEQELHRRLASQYMREVSSKLSSQRYDGASDSDSEELEEETSPQVRRQRAQEYDIDPDDVRGQDVAAPHDDIAEPDLNEEVEMENLLEFARTSLGLSHEQYNQILKDRAARGAYVPALSKSSGAGGDTKTATNPEISDAQERIKEETPTENSSAGEEGLDSFEGVMTEMDRRLSDLKKAGVSAASSKARTASNSSPVAPEKGSLSAEDEELLSHLLKSGGDIPSTLLEGMSSENLKSMGASAPEDTIRADQLADFLRSFQAQATTSGPGSISGPVETLMRRFGLGGLPVNSDPRGSQ